MDCVSLQSDRLLDSTGRRNGKYTNSHQPHTNNLYKLFCERDTPPYHAVVTQRMLRLAPTNGRLYNTAYMDLQPPRVCYTEDELRLSMDALPIFEHFGFEVDHFRSNSQALNDTNLGITANPGRYDVLIIDNNTVRENETRDPLKGTELIRQALQTYSREGKSSPIVILCSLDVGDPELAQQMIDLEKQGVQACSKWFSRLVVRYAREVVDGTAEGTFAQWTKNAFQVDERTREGHKQLQVQDHLLFMEIFRARRKKEQANPGYGKERL